ncbi:uncharacterized protein LY89DRAFT_51219 [Mollisia scopiformis]|uniref:Uncharacterized protein n=1 Tax=Mollisia scopiformis TaxID=149040 RepID=A0A194XC48_MOLSC|nr:uncharacterized protein LY89DRAFT_51219 [Mollisia scopiformis]KUJ17327.1 hypothetical protein LY89DRAFT_51219 [Mollisia scopiformis]
MIDERDEMIELSTVETGFGTVAEEEDEEDVVSFEVVTTEEEDDDEVVAFELVTSEEVVFRRVVDVPAFPCPFVLVVGFVVRTGVLVEDFVVRIEDDEDEEDVGVGSFGVVERMDERVDKIELTIVDTGLGVVKEEVRTVELDVEAFEVDVKLDEIVGSSVELDVGAFVVELGAKVDVVVPASSWPFVEDVVFVELLVVFAIGSLVVVERTEDRDEMIELRTVETGLGTVADEEVSEVVGAFVVTADEDDVVGSIGLTTEETVDRVELIIEQLMLVEEASVLQQWKSC